MEVYLERLERLSREEIAMAVRRTIDEWDKPHMMPPLAFILARTGNGAVDDQFAAEKAWADLPLGSWFGESLLPTMCSTRPKNHKGRIQEYNGGFLVYPEPLDAATDYAVRIVGGFDRIANAGGDKELDFIRRDFLQAHKRYSETVGLIAPSREEAKGFFDSIGGITMKEIQ